jgi:hypothetical protein
VPVLARAVRQRHFSVLDDEVVVGRADVHGRGLEVRSIDGVTDGHRDAAGKHFGEDATGARWEVDDDEATGVAEAIEAGQEALERFDPPGRGADNQQPGVLRSTVGSGHEYLRRYRPCGTLGIIASI